VEALVSPSRTPMAGGGTLRGLGNMKHHSGADIMILLAVEVDGPAPRAPWNGRMTAPVKVLVSD
jgi:hypothetical protein